MIIWKLIKLIFRVAIIVGLIYGISIFFNKHPETIKNAVGSLKHIQSDLDTAGASLEAVKKRNKEIEDMIKSIPKAPPQAQEVMVVPTKNTETQQNENTIQQEKKDSLE